MGNVQRVLAGLAVALSVMSAACGGDDGGDGGDDPSAAADGRREEYVDALLAGDDSAVGDVADGRCPTGALVDAVGVERLEEEVGTPEEVRGDEALLQDALRSMADEVVDRDMIDALYACPGMRDVTVDGFAGEDATSEQRACIDDALTDDFLVWLWTTAMTEVGTEGRPPGFDDRVEEQFGDCGAQ